jgi:hypothetical protein
MFDIAKRIMDSFYKDELGLDNYNSDEIIKAKTALAGMDVIDPKQKIVVYKKESKLITFLLDCSLYTNAEKIMRTDNGGKITCLNGIRFFSMVKYLRKLQFR